MTVPEFVDKFGNNKVRPNRGGWILPCFHPNHKDKTPSLSMTPQGVFMCWGCGYKGSFATALHDRAGYSWKKAIEVSNLIQKQRPRDFKLTPDVKPEVSKGVLGLFDVNWEEGYERYKVAVDEGEDSFPSWAFPFMKGFTAETLRHYQVGFDDQAHRLTIPTFEKNKLKGFVGRTCTGEFPKYFVYPPMERSQHIYNYDALKKSEIAIVTEGAMDVWMLRQKGIRYPACAVSTSKISQTQAKLLRGSAHIFVLMFDGDPAGRKGARQVAQTMLALGCKLDIAMNIPAGVEDIKQLSKSQIERVIAHRKPYPAPSSLAMLG